MLRVSEGAKAYLSQLLAEADAPDEVAVRLRQQRGGLALRLDVPRPHDAIVDHAGRTVLLVDRQVEELLADRQLDVDGTGRRAALALR